MCFSTYGTRRIEGTIDVKLTCESGVELFWWKQIKGGLRRNQRVIHIRIRNKVGDNLIHEQIFCGVFLVFVLTNDCAFNGFLLTDSYG